MLIPLHTHSYYSFLEGLASPAELAQIAGEANLPALALTDHNGLTGAVEFYDASRVAGVNPILGLELDLALPPGLPAIRNRAKSGQVVLLAQDLQGWSSLCQLSSALLSMDGYQPGRGLAFDRFVQSCSGLVCLSGGRNGWADGYLVQDREAEAAAYLSLLKEIFQDRLYVELQGLQPVKITGRLFNLAKKLGLPAIPSRDLYYLHPSQAGLQRVISAIRLNRPVHSLADSDVALQNSCWVSQEEWDCELQAQFQGSALRSLKKALQEVSERCCLELPVGKLHYPEVPLQPGVTAEQELRNRAEAGALPRYGEACLAPGSPVRARLDHELDVIAGFGYASLFLIVEDILNYARRQGIPISSRGSAASSLVAYCLGITSPDPVRLNLYFERFLNPARTSPPDIDTDLCSRRRDEVIHYVYQRYGMDRVAMVCTIMRFRPRSALREVAKAYDLPSESVDALAESLPHRWWSPATAKELENSPFGELERHYTSPTHQAIFRDARALLGLPRHLSVHPGGLVIAPGRMTDLAPVMLATKGVLVTQFDLDSVERMGLVKIDLLGIRGLTVLGDLAQHLSRSSGKRMETPLEALEAIHSDDPETAEAVRNGRTIGCFQIESPGMRATLKEIQAHSVDDLMVALALYRPGPLTGGLKEAFVRRHRGLEPASHLHPALEPLLEDTYGVILYQEQVLRIAHELAGLSLADADLLRRAMSHFNPGKQMETLKQKFITGANARHNIPDATAERIWDLMAAFAGYGFPKAHAASYAQVAWRSAWCKTHYPAIFLAAVLANWGGYYSQRIYLTEARRTGLSLRPPQVNFAQREFSVSYIDGDPVLFMGLDQVRDLTRRTIERILHGRPFHSLADFLARADPRPVEAENLARVGALRDFGCIPQLMEELKTGGWKRGQMSLFPMGGAAQDSQQEDWSLAEKVKAQEALLGSGLDAHPLELVSNQIAAAGALNTMEATARVGERIRIAGMRQTWRRSFSSRGEPIYFMALDDLEGMIDVVIFADVYRRHRAVFSDAGPYCLEGMLERDASSGEPFLRAERAWKFAY